MAEIPVISITQVEAFENSQDEEDDEQLPAGYSISDAHTDVEDLDSDDDDDVRRRSPSSNKMLKIKRKHSRKVSDAGGTDIESYNHSDDSDNDGGCIENDKKYFNNFKINEYLDQGYAYESTTGSIGAGGQTGTKRLTKHMTGLCINDTSAAALTDYENLETSDDDDDDGPRSVIVRTPDVYNSFLVHAEELNCNSIDNCVSKIETQLSNCCTPSSFTSDSETDEKRLKKNKLKQISKQFNVSDVENILFTDDENSNYCGKMKHSPSTFDADIVYIESSDNEIDVPIKNVLFPEIDIMFQRDPNTSGLRNRKHRGTKSASSMSLKVYERDDDAHTDIENLNSSDDEEEQSTPQTKRYIPTAYFKSDHLPLTDVEDFDDGGDDCLSDGNSRDIKMPSPLREMTFVKEHAHGARMSKVMPMLDSNFLGIEDTYLDKGLTDTEDMSGNEEDYTDPTKQYTIEHIPDIDGGVVHNAEYVRPYLKNRKYEKNPNEPITDTEDINMGSTVRRRKPKTRNSQKGKQFLDTKFIPDAPTTDFEDVYMSDNDAPKKHSMPSPLMVPVDYSGDGGAKTDTEYMSGDDDIADERNHSIDIDPSALTNESFFSTVTSKDCCSNTNNQTTFQTIEVPIIRKIAASLDTYLGLTDTEDMQIVSDTDDGLTIDTYSRAGTATPIEFHAALNDCGNSIIYDKNVSFFDMTNEENHIKGHRRDQEVATEDELLDEDVIVAAAAPNDNDDACNMLESNIFHFIFFFI